MRSKIIGHGELLSYSTNGQAVLDTELLHLCWLVEETLDEQKQCDFIAELMDGMGLSLWQRYHTTWQQRVIALAQVKGIEIV